MRTLIVIAALAMATGCNQEKSDEPAPAPSAAQVATVQKAESAPGSMTAVTEAANDAVVDSGSGGAATSSKSSKSYAASSINYQANLDLLVDLDAVDGNGDDLHPYASGVIRVLAAGSVVGTQAAGEANYSLSVTTQTAVSCTDPWSGASATVAAGASFSYALQITWSWTDDQNWTITASCDAVLADYVLTVTDGAEMLIVTVDWEKHGDVTIKAVGGSLTVNASGSEQGTVTYSDGGGAHQVTITAYAAGSVVITVDGSTFGPYTEAQAEATFGIVIE